MFRIHEMLNGIKGLKNYMAKAIETHMEQNKDGFKETGLSTSMTSVAVFLSLHRDSVVYQKDIELALNLGKSTTSALLKSMEAEGYVTREYEGSDARLKKVMATEKAIDISRDIVAVFDSFYARLTEGIAAGDLDIFNRTLAKIKANAERISEQ